MDESITLGEAMETSGKTREEILKIAIDNSLLVWLEIGGVRKPFKLWGWTDDGLYGHFIDESAKN